MRHHCSRCSSEFFDDAPPSSPPARVFCVFCGAPLPVEDPERPSEVPFSVDFPREDAFALGLIGGTRSEFPDTLKQFRTSGGGAAKPRPDSLSPSELQREEPAPPSDADDGQVARFWASLAVGLGVGAVAAALLAHQEAPASVSASSSVALPPPRAPSAAVALPGCAVGSASPASSAPPPLSSVVPAASGRVAVTPALERRFWLDRARTAQREYRIADAERHFRRVLALAPRDSEALAGIGELALLRGAPSDADARFREALEANPDYLPARVGLADLHWQGGQADVARREYGDIVEHYSEELYPPYVKLRLQAEACVPQCP